MYSISEIHCCSCVPFCVLSRILSGYGEKEQGRLSIVTKAWWGDCGGDGTT
jgi:hypothetical protein